MSSIYRNARFLTSSTTRKTLPEETGLEVAFAGRSNSGKSSTLNCLCEQKGLARVSKTPGRTQLINFFDLPDGNRLVDIPGYGYAKVPERIKKEWQQFIVISHWVTDVHDVNGIGNHHGHPSPNARLRPHHAELGRITSAADPYNPK